jgi:tRNA U38,U39,U40 pseudouridine synthase TruA
MIKFTIKAESFGYNMIRNMVSQLIESHFFGRNLSESHDIIRKSLDTQFRKVIVKAPAQGLILTHTSYEKYNRDKVEE